MATPVDIRFLAKALLLAVLAGTVGAIAAFAASYLVQPVYRASVLMVPAEGDSSMLGASGGGVLGAQSVASLVGLGGQSDSVDRGLAILRSRSFCEDFLNPVDKRARFEEEWRARNRLAVMLASRSVSPSTGALCAFLAGSVLALAVDPKTRFVTLSVRLRDRQMAAEWANQISAAVNNKMRNTAVENSSTTLEYLGKELAAANTVELRQAIARAMEAQVRVKAFAATRPSYVFSVVDRAVAADEGSFESPRRLSMAMGGGVLAGFIALLALLVRRNS
jgi:uncharacterized protein involved in exopolysaccharide biosynthesis